MKKIGMVVAAAAVVSYAGAARAQTTEQIIEATATIDSVMSLVETDGLFECGTVTGFGTVSADCPDAAAAQVEVTANQNWTLSVEDLIQTGSECDLHPDGPIASAGSDKVTLCNDDAASKGTFVVSLDYAGGCPETTLGTDNESIDGTSAEGCLVDIVQDTDTGDAIAGLGTDDGFGVYNGSFSVTLSPAP